MIVDVTNSGALAGDEVVQVYLKNLTATVPVPKYTLVGFKRVFLQPGETKKVAISLPAKAFSIINDQNERVTVPGRFEIYAGGKQPFISKGKPAEGVLKAEVAIGD
jgi:beta-glucosidase